jgi:SWI/SNF-related matrix-associated actin-dependent regulator 1 of chromatin subfamily A
VGEFGDPDFLDFAKVLHEVQTSSDLTIHLRCLAHPRSLAQYALPPSLLLDAGKMQHLVTLLPRLRADGHRALIFSQWTSVLDLIGLALEHLGMRFVRFDGSTHIDERTSLIDDFDADPSITCFLLTTRTGGLGINLTTADTCIIYDSDFNPAADKQAMDRCHRMGQTRPVRVLKLAASETVDERIVQIATAKMGQRAMLFDEGGEGEDGAGAAHGTPHGRSGQALMGTILRETIFGSSAAANAEPEACNGAAEKTAEAATEPEAKAGAPPPPPAAVAPTAPTVGDDEPHSDSSDPEDEE